MRSRCLSPRRSLPLFVVLPLFIVGCEDDKIRSYEVPKAWSSKSAEPVTWTAPTSWTRSTVRKMGRHATFVAKTSQGHTEIVLSQFSGALGGTLPNVNRWRAFVGLEKLEEKDLAAATQTIELGTSRATIVDCVGEKERILAAIVARQDETWTVKCQDELANVAEIESDVRAFISSLRFAEEAGR
ncbi:MAG: hypothetical protein AAF517_13785 [Planctomycetota bacterium]